MREREAGAGFVPGASRQGSEEDEHHQSSSESIDSVDEEVDDADVM